MHTLITFPRSGAHFFQNYLKQATGYEIEKTHKPVDIPHVLTIVRDPIESIASFSAMLIEYNGHSVEETVAKLIENYEAYYTYFSHHAELVIDYNKLITEPENTVSKFTDIAGIKFNKISYVDDIVDMKDKRHFKTSKNKDSYTNSIDMLNRMKKELESCYDKYNNLLRKSIS